MRVPAPAKINLHLRVGPARSDGFHPLLTWMVTVGLFDTLTLVRQRDQPAGVSSDDGFERDWFKLATNHLGLPVDEGNLVVRAANALADTLSRNREGPTAGREGVSAFLNKNVPSGAGLGGGSSDAAATLIGLNRLWKLNWPMDRLAGIAARLGSDIPFFFHGPSSICTGRGEIVRPIPAPMPKWAVLVLPNIEMPTPAVYRRFDEMKLGETKLEEKKPEEIQFGEMNLGGEQFLSREPDWLQWVKRPARELLEELVNDLEPPSFAIRPELGRLRSDLERELGRIVRMSGSGSSLFTLCDEAAEAERLAGRASQMFKVDAKAVQLAPTIGLGDDG